MVSSKFNNFNSMRGQWDEWIVSCNYCLAMKILSLTLPTPCFKHPAYYWYKNAPTNEEFEEKLRENYSHNITNSRVSSITFQSVPICTSRYYSCVYLIHVETPSGNIIYIL